MAFRDQDVGGMNQSTTKAYKETFWDDKKVHIKIVVLITGLYTFAKTHGILHLKSEIFTINYTSIKQILKRL